jgi:ribulose-bisphosphate carboxylase large chain
MQVVYRVKGQTNIQAKAESLAIEQSVEMPLEAIRQPHILQTMVGKVASILPFGTDFMVTLELSDTTIDSDPTQLLNMLFGNASLHSDTELVDFTLSQGLLNSFSGPRYGTELTQLVQAKGAITCAALKPQGMAPQELAELAHLLALGGVHIIKDDHGISNQSHAPFHLRVPQVQLAVQKANQATGQTTLYAPMLSGRPRELSQRLQVVRDLGIKAVLVAPMLIGLPGFLELLEQTQVAQVAILAHPAFAGYHIAPPALAKLFRLFGADAVIFPNYGGRFAYSQDTCLALAQAARAPWGHLKPALPAPAGGMTLERVPELLQVYGPQTMILLGGNLLYSGVPGAENAPENISENITKRTKALLAAVNSV